MKDYTVNYLNRNTEKDMSIRGVAKVHGIKYSVWALLFDAPSHYGINGGRISKLTIKNDGFKEYYKNGVVYDYDRNTWNTRRDFPDVLDVVVKSLEEQPNKFAEVNALINT